MDPSPPSQAAIEAQRRHALKLRLRQQCLALKLDVEHVFDTPEAPQASKDLVSPDVFFKTMALKEIRFTEDEKSLFPHFSSPSGLISLKSFFHYLDLQRPADHVDPDLTFALLPQPFRMLAKILEDDILDRAWAAISSSISFKLQQGQLNADLQEKEAKALLSPPSAVATLGVSTPSLAWPIRVSGDRDMIGMLHGNTSLELLQANGEQTMAPTVPLFASPRLQVQCLSELTPMRFGQVKRTFFAVAAWKLPKPPPPPPADGAPAQPVVDVPDPVLDALESLVHVYATDGVTATLRCTLASIDHVVRLTLAEDVSHLAVQFESGVVEVYRTSGIATDIESSSVLALDTTYVALHVEPESYRIHAPSKGVTPEAAAAPVSVPAKADKHKDKGGKGGKDHAMEEAPVAVAPPVVYSSYLFLAFLVDPSHQPAMAPSTSGIVIASQFRMLQYRLDASPQATGGTGACTSVVLASKVSCAVLDTSATVVVLGLESGSVFGWNTRLHVEHSGLGCHGAPVMALALFKAEFLVSLSAGNEVHFYALRADVAQIGGAAKSMGKSLVRVRTGELGTPPYVSVSTLSDVPLTILGQTDGTATVVDSRTGDVIGSLSVDGRQPIQPSHPFVVGDTVYVPTSSHDTDGSVRIIRLNSYSSASILRACFPHSPLSAPSNFLDRFTQVATPTAPPAPSTASSKPTPSPPSTSGPPSSSHVARLRRPSMTGSSTSVLARANTATSGLVVPSSCSFNLAAPPPTKCLQAIYMRVLQKQEVVAAERDGRLAKRRADVLKTLNSIW